MVEDAAIPEIISAHLAKQPNKYTMKKGAKSTKVLINSIKDFDETLYVYSEVWETCKYYPQWSRQLPPLGSEEYEPQTLAGLIPAWF